MSGIYLFFSYSHKDEGLRDELETHLASLRREGKIRSWHDRKITGGQEWARQIDDNLKAADVILLLVSPTFVASDYCWDVELKHAMRRHEAGEARVIPVILRPADWQNTPFGKLQALPKNATPVTKWPDRDEAFLDVARGLRAVIEEIEGKAAPPSPSAPSAPPPARGTPRDLVDALASTFDSEAAAVGLLGRAGVPTSRLKPFASMAPVQYWESVCRELEKGLVAAGLASLLREAAAAYPHNPAFRQGTGTVTPPASGGGEGALQLWREKLEHLLTEEAISSDPSQKFTLKKEIEKARQKILELGGAP